jgi:hypothetical protein
MKQVPLSVFRGFDFFCICGRRLGTVPTKTAINRQGQAISRQCPNCHKRWRITLCQNGEFYGELSEQP